MFKKIITYLFIFFSFTFFVSSYANNDILDNNIKIQSGLEKIENGLGYTCIKKDCKINLDVIGYTDKNYNCIWDFGGGIFKTKNTDKKCNPGYVSYKKGKYEIKLTILDKKTSKNILNQKLIIFNGTFNQEEDLDNIKELKENTYSQEVSLENNNIIGTKILNNKDVQKEKTENNQLDELGRISNNNLKEKEKLANHDDKIKKQVINLKKEEIKTKIIIQSGLNYDNGNIWKCKNTDCKVNLIATGITDKNYNCIWDFGGGSFKTKDTDKKCNPGYVIYKTGIYNVSLKVLSKDDAVLYNSGIIIQNIFKDLKKNLTIKKISKDSSVIKKIENKKEINNFPIAKIRLQGRQASYKKIVGNKIICNGVSKCSVNFTGEDSIDEDKKSLKYIWDFGNNKKFIGVNPKSVYFQIGKYKIELKLIDNKAQESKAYFYVEVMDKQDNSLNSNISIDKNIFKDVKISGILPNNKGKDTREFIELINNGNNKINLKGLIIKDNSKKFNIKDDLFILPKKRKRFYKRITKLSLGNKKDGVFIYYNDKKLDSLSWDFSIPDDFMLTHENINLPLEKVKVLRVVDGDTIKILFKNNRKIKVRFLGIDTPETKDPRKSIQFYGKQASEFTKRNLEGKYVYLEYSKQNLSGKYNRLLAYVYLDKDKQNNFNKILVEKGYARVYLNYPFKYEKDFLKAQKIAKKGKIGIWQDRNIKKEVLKIQKEEKINRREIIKTDYLKDNTFDINKNYQNIYNDLGFISNTNTKKNKEKMYKNNLNDDLIIKNINKISKSIKYRVIKNKKSLKITGVSDFYKSLIIKFQSKNYSIKVGKDNKFSLKINKIIAGKYRLYFYGINQKKEKVFIKKSRNINLATFYINNMSKYYKKIEKIESIKKKDVLIKTDNTKNITKKINVLENAYIKRFDFKGFILNILIGILSILFVFMILFKKNILQNN